MTIQLFIIFLYVALQLVIGYVVSKKIKTEEDYFLGGRQFGTLLVSFSAFATWFGAETCIGSAGAVYSQGLSGGRADPLGYTLCLVLFALFLAKRIWSKKITTLGDLYRERFSPNIEVLASAIIIPSSIFWAAAQVRAMGQIISSASPNFDLNTGIGIATLIVVAYITMGGLMADAFADILQGVLIGVGLLALTVVVVYHTPEPLEVLKHIPPERLNPFGNHESPWFQIDRWAVPIFGSLVAQELILRVNAAKSVHIAKKGVLIGGVIYFCIGSLPVLMGLVGPTIMPGLVESEQLLPALAKIYLPGAFYLLFAGALVSAILSTIDGALLASGSLFAHNILPKFLPAMSDKRKVLIARLSVMASGTVAYFLAISADKIYDLIESASSVGSSGILVTTLFALFTPWGNALSAGASLIAGLVFLILGHHWGWTAPYITSVGMAFVFYVGTLLIQKIKSKILS